MTRNFVLATAALAVAGWAVASSPADAGYVLSGLKEYANAPMKQLSASDCRATYNGEVRLVSSAEFAKYLAKHPDYKAVAPRRHNIGFSGMEPRRPDMRLSNWIGACGR